MHDVDVNAVGLADYGKPGSYFERQLGRWTKQYRATETDRIDAMEKLISWLSSNMPADDGQVSLIHGDFRLDNIIFQAEKPEAMAVLDWELSTLGHPMADLAYFCMCLRLPPAGHIKGLAGLDLDILGIPSETDIIARYCERRGIEHIEHWTFYLAFSFFRLAAIAQGVLKRALDGNASSEKALQAGTMAGVLEKLHLLPAPAVALAKPLPAYWPNRAPT
jgi:aminoglycoside phosphotransferase (APT) family kinase protein